MRTDAPANDTAALPVAIHVAGALGERVRAFTEGVVGWQAIEEGAASMVPPVLTVADADAPGAGPRPMILLVDEDRPADVAARAAARLRPDAVLAWPDERDRLAATADELLVAAGPAAADGIVDLRVAGAAGGVGTSTVALAVAGLATWSGQTTLLLGAGHLPAPAGGPVPVDALTAPGLWDRAAAAPGLSRLRVLATDAPPDEVAVAVEPATVVVRDCGVSDDTDVLVARRDAAGLAALERSVAAVNVIVDVGPASHAAVTAACGGRRRTVLPHDVRVARAGLAGRVPAGLPGAWLKRLGSLQPRPA